MITGTQQTIIAQVRCMKEENAAEHGYSIEAIIEAARERQEASGRHIIRLTKGEQNAVEQPATRLQSKSK